VADGRDAIVSRGELIEIGGSFRIPDIMAKSGAVLTEIGTTNRTHLEDYTRALSPRTGAIVKVHRSNFEVRGFVADVPLADLAPVANQHGIPLLHDFGSGLLISLAPWGLEGEPTAADAVRAGATLVVMSGDKLMGGPQAGVMLGSAQAIAACRQNPLVRALRVDKLTLSALEATLALSRDPAQAVREIPALAMLTAPLAEIRSRAAMLSDLLASRGIANELAATEASVGGGAFPTARLPSLAVAFLRDAQQLEERLRRAEPAVIGRLERGRLLLDLRSVPAALDDAFAAAVVAALS
jgi:L-seryl-tRNA(Ser) seleniumtransferase